MFTTLLLTVLTSLPTSASTSQAPYYCIAKPHFYNVRVPKLPGYGYGDTQAEATAAALKSCERRNPFGPRSRCQLESCFRN